MPGSKSHPREHASRERYGGIGYRSGGEGGDYRQPRAAASRVVGTVTTHTSRPRQDQCHVWRLWGIGLGDVYDAG
jgi:hypothetical protein